VHLIKKCPSCGSMLRFPIDKGKIRIKCKCGFSFTADPDDPSLYSDSEFDIKPDRKKKNAHKKFFPSIIIYLYEFKYDLQNFWILPSSKKRILIKIAAAFILAGAAAAVYKFRFL